MPQFPEKRTKQSWAEPNNQLKFSVDPIKNEIGQNSFDLIKEINASKIFSEIEYLIMKSNFKCSLICKEIRKNSS